MIETYQNQTNTVEDLIPKTGVEHQVVGEGQSDVFSHVPLGSEPLFEQDGAKALAQIKITQETGTPGDTYYVVDVSSKDYTRINTQDNVEKVNYLLVTKAFFDEKGGNQNNLNFASIRSGGPYTECSRTVVGGHYHNTRFGSEDSKNTLAVSITGSAYNPSILIGSSEYGGSGMEVSFMRSRTDPADIIATHREEVANGGIKSEEHAKQGKKIKARFIGAVQKTFDKAIRPSGTRTDFHYENDEMQYDPSRGHFKEAYDDMNLHDLEVLDDKFGLKAENSEMVANALNLLEDQTRQDVVTSLTEDLKGKRVRRALGWIGSSAAMLGAVYFDSKTGGVISEGKDSDVNNLATAAEFITIGASLHMSTKLGEKLVKAHRILKKGLDNLLPEAKVHEFKGDVSDSDFIRDVANKHQQFLYELDKSVHTLRQHHDD